jgi:hypothetical protein
MNNLKIKLRKKLFELKICKLLVINKTDENIKLFSEIQIKSKQIKRKFNHYQFHFILI